MASVKRVVYGPRKIKSVVYGFSAFAVITALAVSGQAVLPWEKTPACGDYGTAIEFEPTPKAAAKRAAAEEKLVLVLHVSGHFEDPGLT
ncbi:hypothetical protein HRbin36_01206 [bacterium HR36]|nr:hypothetical protein HRbin36_01206 [bacterium HR36]